LVNVQRRGRWMKLIEMLQEAFEQVDLIPHTLPNKPETWFALAKAGRQYYFPRTSDTWLRLYCRCQGRKAEAIRLPIAPALYAGASSSHPVGI
jgi:hypothetical protein